MQKRGTLGVRKKLGLPFLLLLLPFLSLCCWRMLLAGAEGNPPLFPGHQCGPCRTWGSAEGVATQISNVVQLVGAQLRTRLSPDHL